MKYIQAETSTRVQIKGIGSGFIDQEVGHFSILTIFFKFAYSIDWTRRACPSIHPYHVCCLSCSLGRISDNFDFSGPEEGQVARAKVLTEDLLLVVRQEHAKVAVLVQQQQMELHQAQAQYAAYSAMGVSNISLLTSERP